MNVHRLLHRIPSIWSQQCCLRNRSFVVASGASKSVFCKKIDQFSPKTYNYIHPHINTRLFSKSSWVLSEKGPTEEENTNIFQRFKKMSKDYWYVLVPVHLATSIVWFGGFYVMCKSGVDVAALLQWVGVSETYVEKLSNSEMGYAALAYACYKIATPIRYTITVGGTTMTVKYLSDLGYLKTSNQVAEQFKEKADTITQDVKEIRDDWKDRQEKYKDALKDEWADAWKKFGQKKKKK